MLTHQRPLYYNIVISRPIYHLWKLSNGVVPKRGTGDGNPQQGGDEELWWGFRDDAPRN